MLKTLRRRAAKVGLGIEKQRGRDCYMVYDLSTRGVIGCAYYVPYPLTLEDVAGIVAEYEKN